MMPASPRARRSPVTTALLVAAFALGADRSGADGSSGNETLIRTTRPTETDETRVRMDGDVLTPTPEDALAAAAGVSVVHDGGPLAPTRLFLRGLSGPRVSADLDGLSLMDPATGAMDLSSLPWAAVGAARINSGALDGTAGVLRLVPHLARGVRSSVLVGALNTVRASVFASDGDHAVAADLGMSRGDFVFAPTSSVSTIQAPLAVRQNNDHRRARVFASSRADIGDATARLVAFAAAHEGGIPGLATHPTDDIRGQDGALGARAALEHEFGNTRLAVAVDARAMHRATWGPLTARSALESAAGGVSIDAAGMNVGTARIDMGSRADVTTLVDGRFSRATAAADVTLRMPVGSARLDVRVDARALSDLGGLWGGSARLETGDALRVAAGIARAARAPTLDEMYAPRGFVVGNPKLLPEVFDDVEFTLSFAPGPFLDARIVGFAGVIEEGIAWVNRNAVEVAPVNLGRGWRVGCDTAIRVAPSGSISLEVATGLLWSHVEATGEPLPLAPPFASRVALRLGHLDGVHVVGVTRSRTAAASNLFGTLVAAPYTLVDIAARMPVSRGLTLGMTLSNVFDVTDARDVNQLPLPGRLVFFSLEVQS